MAAPTIGSISPSGPTAGSTLITITGTNFISGNTTVTIGGVSATGVAFSSNSTITATISSGTVGAQDVVVTTPGGSATLTGGFTYVASSSGGGVVVGGGGGGSVINLNIQGFASSQPLKTTSDGVIQEAAKITSIDGMFTLDIAKGTKVLSKILTAVVNLSVAPFSLSSTGTIHECLCCRLHL